MSIKALENKNALLKKMFEHERMRANEWREVAERSAETIEQLQARLKDSINKHTALKTKCRNTDINRTMYKWYLEYLADGNCKEIAYFCIYVNAVKADFLKKIKHKDHENANALGWKTGIEDKIQKHLKAHCKLNNIPYPE